MTRSTYARMTNMPQESREYDQAAFSTTDYLNSRDLAIWAGAHHRPDAAAQLIGKDDFASLLIRYTVGCRASRQNERSRATTKKSKP